MRRYVTLFAADTGQPVGGSTPDELAQAAAALGGEAGRTFTQAEVDQLIDTRLKRQRAQLDAEKRELEKANETKQLEEQKRFEELATQRGDELNKLKPRADLADTYEKEVGKLLLEWTKDLPSAIQQLLNKLPLPDQIDWLATNAKTLKPQAARGDTNINAYGRGAPQSGLTDEEYLARKRASGIYQ